MPSRKEAPQSEYQIVNLDQYNSKLDTTREERNSYLYALGRNHTTTHNILLTDDGLCEIPFASKTDSFKLNLRFGRASYDIVIDKGNRAYSDFKNDRNENNDFHIIRKNIQIIGIPVGDILRYYYYNHLKNEPLSEEFIQLVKKSLSVDTMGSECKNALGMGAYRYGSKSFYLWDSILPPQNTSFTAFCKRIVFFGVNVVAFDRDCKNNLIPNDKQNSKFFCNLVDKNYVNKLLNYYQYGEDPEESQLKVITYNFEEPKSICNVMEFMYEQDNEQCWLDAKKKILQKINTHEAGLLETRYKKAVYHSLKQVPDEYPTYALRNVYVKIWTVNGPESDSGNITFYSGNSLGDRDGDQLARDNTYKYKVKKTGKFYSFNDMGRWHRWHSYGYNKSDKGRQKQKALQFSGVLRDYHDILRDKNNHKFDRYCNDLDDATDMWQDGYETTSLGWKEDKNSVWSYAHKTKKEIHSELSGISTIYNEIMNNLD